MSTWVQDILNADRANPKPKPSSGFLRSMANHEPLTQEEALQKHFADSIKTLKAARSRRAKAKKERCS